MPYFFSSSTLSLLKDCPRCFWLQFNKKIKRPTGIFPSLPSGMDGVLKTHFDSFRDKNELPPELNSLKGDVQLFSDKKLLEDWRNWRKGLRWTDEHENILMGAVDNLLQKKDKLILLDYKTRGYPLKDDSHSYYQDQLDIYSFLLQKNGYDTEKYAYLLFYHPTRVAPNGDVVFHSDLKKISINPKSTEKILQNALNSLSQTEPKPSTTCEYCQWNKTQSDKD